MQIFITLILIVHTLSVNASQSYPKIKRDSVIYLNIENFNFFKNSEFFNPLTDGYTDPGFFLNTDISWKFSKKIILAGGVHLLKYSGENNFHNIQPIFRVIYNPGNRFQLILGSLIKKKSIELPDYLYFDDLFWRRQSETGIQLLFNYNRLKSDIWIDWENHINEFSKDQEEFIFGLSGTYLLADFSKKVSISIPFSTIVNHRGGQINASGTDLVTLANSHTGLNMTWDLVQIPFSLSVEYNISGFNDLSQSKNLFYSSGYAHNYEISFYNLNFAISSQYWKSYHFISSRGNPVFMSISDRNNWYSRPERNLLINGIKMTHHINNNAGLNLEFKSFYDIDRLDFDYSILLSLAVNFSKPVL